MHMGLMSDAQRRTALHTASPTLLPEIPTNKKKEPHPSTGLVVLGGTCHLIVVAQLPCTRHHLQGRTSRSGVNVCAHKQTVQRCHPYGSKGSRCHPQLALR